MLYRLRQSLRPLQEWLTLPAEAKQRLRADRKGLRDDPGPETAMRLCLDWLCAAQDNSASADGGVARHYNLINGWAPSYPETTGYLIPTWLQQARRLNDAALIARAQNALNWLVSIQFPDGGFQGGTIGATPCVPVTFNTGQILLGLAAGAHALGDTYKEPMLRAANWLRDTLDEDGCWRTHQTPFAAPGEKAYETHVAWGLMEAERVAPGQGYGEAALHQVRWALTKMQDNGWVADCCLNMPQAPLTHTLGYFLRGVVEGWRLSNDPVYLTAALKMADGLLRAQWPDGAWPGRLKHDWSAAVSWSCLTGNVQIAHSFFLLAAVSDREELAQAAKAANRVTRRTLDQTGTAAVKGAVAGSYPVDGDYGRWEFLNWAAKFLIDAQMAELGRP